MSLRRDPSSIRRRTSPSRRPAVEAMEGRQLLAAVPLVTITSPIVTEGTGANSVATFTVNLTSASDGSVTMKYQTADRSAVAGSDYLAAAGTLTFAPGEKSKTISVAVIGDAQAELTEAFALQLSDAQNARLVGSLGIATILDDDTPVPPKLSVADVSMVRGLSGSRTMVFTISLNSAQKSAVTLGVATSDVTAVAGRDYAALNQQVTFAAGETSKQVSVTIYGTSIVTSDKIFFLKLSGASVEVSRGSAAGIIKFGA